MPITVTVTKTLRLKEAEEWIVAALSDGEIVNMVRDDLADFVDGAAWIVEREA